MGWFAEVRDRDDQTGQWMRVGFWRKTVKRAKLDAKDQVQHYPHLAATANYRIVKDDDRGTIEATSECPHGKRMRWCST